MIGTLVSNMMIKPGQSPLWDAPEAHGLDYEDVVFEARDGVKPRGWLIKGGTDKVIVQSHIGVQCNRAGWTPKGHGLFTPWKQDIQFLRQAKTLQEHGYSILMYDFRGHGESDLGSIPWISWGPEEAKDVIAAVDYITSRPEFADASIGLLSICMGSGAMTYAYGMDDGLATRTDVKAIIAVQPLLYTCFLDALGMPGPLVRAGNTVSERRLGFNLGAANFHDHASKITVPTLVLQNKNDPWTQLDMVQSYYDRVGGEIELRMLDLEKSRFAACDYVGTHMGDLDSWFAKHM